MMNHSRKQVLAQIARTNKLLQHRQHEVLVEKAQLRHYRQSYSFLLIGALMVPALWFGWKLQGEKWAGKVTRQFVDIVTLVFFSYFKQQVTNFLK